MKTKVYLLVLTVCCIFLSCDKDDDASNSESDFYSGALTSASAADLSGIWAIFNVGFQGNMAEVPIVYPDCGRDFIVFSENGLYTEYAYQQSDCIYSINSLDWTLKNGIIDVSDPFGQSDEWVITKLNANELVFKSLFDVDEDGKLDVISLYLKRYTPKEIDLVSPTFRDNPDAAFDNLISFTWQPYQGFNDFERYEIYRSAGGNCNLSNTELVASISDVHTTVFTDLSPPAENYVCYFFKIYTTRGLLGQSYANSVNTENLYPQPVTLNVPQVLNTSIQFDWQASEDPYFSHYELAFSNYEGGTGSGQQEYSVAIINDRDQTTFLDEHPPYLEDPYYVLYVHNIFGKQTSFQKSQVTTYHMVDFKRPEIINFQMIKSFAIDDKETVVYFYGRENGTGNTMNIHRFNYSTNQTEAISNLAPNTMTSLPIQYVDSGYGPEIIVEQGSDLAVYNATTLQYKYTLDLRVQRVNDFLYSALGYWVVVDGDNVYTFIRDNANMEIVDTKPHFSKHQSSYNYKAFALNNNKLLVGHNNEATSYLFALTANGLMNQEQIVSIPILNGWEQKSQYNPAGNYLINFLENRLYSTTSFNLLQSFESPYFPSGTSQDGTLIFGSNNDPKWEISPKSIHAKEAVIFNRLTKQSTTVSTIGYPHIIFENAVGDIISISSGLKKDDIGQNNNHKADIFLETIQRP